MMRPLSRFTLSALAAVLALASEAGAQRLAGRGMPRRSPLITTILLDFHTEDDFVTPLANGQAISSPDEFGRLVSISSSGANAGPAIFDSTPGGPNDPCQDMDLLIGLDNVLILQNSQATAQTAGVFDRPNDDQDGGELIFDFTTPVEPEAIALIDIDAGAQQGSSVTLTDENGRTRVYSVPPRWTRDLVADGPPSHGILSLGILDPQPGFLSTATATQDLVFDSAHVVRLVVRLGSSGAVDDLSWTPGRALGMVGDVTAKSVVVFDADVDEVLGSVTLLPAASSGVVGDCVIDARRSLGYVTDFQHQVWVIDLAQSPPGLAAGINPMLVSNPAEDLSLSPDGRFLAVSDGSAEAPLAIVDLGTRAEVGTVSTTDDCNSVDFCSHDTLVGTSIGLDQILGFSLAGDGTPSLSGDVLGLSLPNNVSCAPGGRAGVGITRYPTRQLLSFQVEGLVLAETRSVPGLGLSACFSPDGRRLFLREYSQVLAWTYAPLTGTMGVSPLYSLAVGGLDPFYGMERIAVHPDGTRLYVPQRNSIRIYNPANGVLLGSIPIPGVLKPSGIAVERGLR